MNIVYAFTADYAPKAFPSMRSLKEHNPKAKVFVVTETDELDLPIEAEIINIKDQTWFPPTGVNYRNQFTYINLLKVMYPSVLPVNKVIHLDCDTIICDSLEPLWKTDLKGKWFAACPEYRGRYRPFGDMYYNMGVAVINLQQMRKDGIEAVMAEYLNTVPQPYADQDAWNKYGIEQDKVAAFPIRYNECFATGETDSPAIVHYCGYINWFNNDAVPRMEYIKKWL